MRTFADLKRTLKPGLKLKVLAHWQEKLIGTTRTVDAVQTNGYWFYTEGDARRMWADLGKASNWAFPSTSQAQFSMGDRGWTLEVVEAA